MCGHHFLHATDLSWELAQIFLLPFAISRGHPPPSPPPQQQQHENAVEHIFSGARSLSGKTSIFTVQLASSGEAGTSDACREQSRTQ